MEKFERWPGYDEQSWPERFAELDYRHRVLQLKFIPTIKAAEERATLAEQWQPLATAPKDGTLVELIIDYDGGDHPLQDATLACTIGFNNLDNDGEDVWKFAGWCWTHDHFTEGRGSARAWRPSRLNDVLDDDLPALRQPTGEGEG